MGQINVIDTKIRGIKIIEPKVFGDDRGWFFESFSKKDYETHGIVYDFIQDNQSYSKEKGIIRGLHFQNGEHAQAKLVRCVQGAVLDVAVDLRSGSPTYRQWFSVVLSEENKRQFMIPRGFGHLFMTITDDVQFVYKTDNYYNYDADRSINYADPDLAINLEFAKHGIISPILSDKDKNAPYLKDSDCSFIY